MPTSFKEIPGCSWARWDMYSLQYCGEMWVCPNIALWFNMSGITSQEGIQETFWSDAKTTWSESFQHNRAVVLLQPPSGYHYAKSQSWLLNYHFYPYYIWVSTIYTKTSTLQYLFISNFCTFGKLRPNNYVRFLFCSCLTCSPTISSSLISYVSFCVLLSPLLPHWFLLSLLLPHFSQYIISYT